MARPPERAVRREARVRMGGARRRPRAVPERARSGRRRGASRATLIPDTGGRLEGVDVFSGPRASSSTSTCCVLLLRRDRRPEPAPVHPRRACNCSCGGRRSTSTACRRAVALRDPPCARGASSRATIRARRPSVFTTCRPPSSRAVPRPRTAASPIAWTGGRIRHRPAPSCAACTRRRRMGHLVQWRQSRAAIAPAAGDGRRHPQAARAGADVRRRRAAEDHATRRRRTAAPAAVVRGARRAQQVRAARGHEPIKDMLFDIAQRGRSLGVLLVGAQQTASEVEPRSSRKRGDPVTAGSTRPRPSAPSTAGCSLDAGARPPAEAGDHDRRSPRS